MDVEGTVRRQRQRVYLLTIQAFQFAICNVGVQSFQGASTKSEQPPAFTRTVDGQESLM